MQNDINYGCGNPTRDDVDGIMGLDIDGGKAHQHIEGHHAPEEGLAPCLPRQEHQNGGDAHMTAGESGSGPFACIMGTLHQGVEESVAPSGGDHSLHVGGEVVADIWVHAAGDILQTCCQIIVLRSRDGQEDKDDIVDEEGREDDELRTEELLISLKEIEQRDDGYQGEIRGIAQMHEFTEDGMCIGLRKE